ncbi:MULTISPECIES: hypothetical protein [Neorhizobium]|uniref:hypothetical protein n=1 Tax=Neorhizobium TaxID=1525371 RepID=UPI0005641174|nr:MULTISPECIES: hypothetical protein [Neorhizobium]
MKFNGIRLALATAAYTIASTALVPNGAHAAEYSFTATNGTKSPVTKVLVSENKKDWGYFDIGSGIKPGTTVDLVWDKSTNSESCTQWVKANFADGSESEPAKFDFCEDGLEIEF